MARLECCMSEENDNDNWCVEFLNDFMMKQREDDILPYLPIGEHHTFDVEDYLTGEYGGANYCIFHMPLTNGRKVWADKNGEERSLSSSFMDHVLRENVEYYSKKQTNVNQDSLGVPFMGSVFPYELEITNVILANRASLFEVKENFSNLLEVNGNFDFSNCKFYSETSLYSVRLNGVIYFDSAVFYNKFHLLSSEFRNGISFFDCKFKEGVLIENIEVSQTIDEDLYYASFESSEFFKMSKISGVIFKDPCDFKNVYIENSLVFEDCNLKKVEFLGTDVDKIDFINCDYPEDSNEKGRGDIFYDELLYEKGKSELSYDQKRNKLKKIQTLYRKAKEKYMREQNWGIVSMCHYNEKTTQRKKFRLDGLTGDRIVNTAYWLLSGYNERPIWAIIILIFMLFGLSFGFCEGLDALEYLPFIKTIDSVEYKDAVWARPFVMFMQTLITMQIALVIMSVRNKLRR